MLLNLENGWALQVVTISSMDILMKSALIPVLNDHAAFCPVTDDTIR